MSAHGLESPEWNSPAVKDQRERRVTASPEAWKLLFLARALLFLLFHSLPFERVTARGPSRLYDSSGVSSTINLSTDASARPNEVVKRSGGHLKRGRRARACESPQDFLGRVGMGEGIWSENEYSRGTSAVTGE